MCSIVLVHHLNCGVLNKVCKLIMIFQGGLTLFQIAIVSVCAVGAFAMLIMNAVAIICKKKHNIFVRT